MKAIITLLIFICFCMGAVAARKDPPKKAPSRKETAAAKRKKIAADKIETVQPKPKDSVVMPKDENLIVHVQHTDTLHDAQEEPIYMSVSAPVPVSDYRTWIPWISLLLMLIMAIYIFWRNAHINSRFSRIQSKLDAQISDLQWQKNKPLLTTAEIENLINASSSMKKMQEELSTFSSNIDKIQQTPQVAIPVKPIPEPQGGTFYMTGPTSNYFPSSARSANRENTVYKFVLQPGGNEAMFEVHTTGASISEIVKVVESYIKPACDEENLPFSGIRNIVTRTPGRAMLENDKWIIKDKAVIRYE